MKKIDTRVKVLSFIGLVIALTILTIFASNGSMLFDLRQRATSSNGPGRIVVTNPNGSTLNPNFPQTFTLAVTKLNSYIVDGIQVGVTISGSVPADLTFTPETIPGLSLVANSIRTEGTNRYLTLAYVTASPLQPFTIEPVSLKLGTFQANNVSGPITFAPDNTLSKVLLHQSDTTETIVDLLGQSTPNTFVLSTVAPTALPTVTPKPTLVPTPVATVLPTNSPTPMPTIAPTALPTVQPTPTATPRPATPRPTAGTNTTATPTIAPTPVMTATPIATIRPTAPPVSRPSIQDFIRRLLERYPWLRSRLEQQRNAERLF